MDAYGSALLEMGNCSLDACPGTGRRSEEESRSSKDGPFHRHELRGACSNRCRRAGNDCATWGRDTAKHYQQKACEVKELLLVMARTAESVSARDQRCAGQMSEVTERLKAIASLEDLTEIRASIEKSATELKTSIDRMTAEGKAGPGPSAGAGGKLSNQAGGGRRDCLARCA